MREDSRDLEVSYDTTKNAILTIQPAGRHYQSLVVLYELSAEKMKVLRPKARTFMSVSATVNDKSHYLCVCRNRSARRWLPGHSAIA